METRTIIKYGAYAVAAYVVYRYVSAQPWFQSLLTMGTVPTTGTTPTTGTAATTTTASTTTTQPAAASPASAQPTEETFRRAVSDETYARQLPISVALNPDQWNYYRALATGQEQPDPLLMGYTPGTRQYAVTAAQYWDSLRSVGLSGLSQWQTYDARVN